MSKQDDEDDVKTLVLDGIDLGLTRRVAKLYETCSSPNSDVDSFARGLALVVQRYVEAVKSVDELFSDRGTKKRPEPSAKGARPS